MNPIEAYIELEERSIVMELEEEIPEIILEVEDYIGGTGSAPPDYYEGEYEVVPKISPQILWTKHKTMERDVSVAEIPFHEFSNEYGGTTAVIGGIL